MSSYIDHLPAVLQADEFLGRFLLAFEAVLSGHDDVEEPGLDDKIARLADYLDPAAAPEEFLPWLAGWVAFSFRADWSPEIRRSFLQEIVPLYRRRGTKAGLLRMLEIYVNESVEVTKDTVVIDDGFTDPPHFFQVQLTLEDEDRERLRRTQEIARAIIDQEKPAHTFYALRVVVPTMRLVSEQLKRDEKDKPALLILGKNTWLGTATPDIG